MSSSKDKSAAPAAKEAELKKPEAALKRGEEPQPKTETPKAEPKTESKPESKEPVKDEAKTSEPSEGEKEKKKEKGGFFSWLKRKFK
jgi:hypothetical protein